MIHYIEWFYFWLIKMNNHNNNHNKAYQITDQSLFIIKYPNKFNEQRMHDIAELLRTIEINTLELYSDNYPENKTILKISKELFSAMNKTVNKISKCESYIDVYKKLYIIMNQCIKQKRPGFGSNINQVKTTYERSEIHYHN